MGSLKERTIVKSAEKIKNLIHGVRVIYTDIDGTLLGPGGCLFLTPDKEYTLQTAEAIILTHKCNLDVVMVSGRNKNQLLGDARILGFKNYIAELGCEIVYNLSEKVILNVGNFQITEGSVFNTIANSKAPEFLLKTFSNRLEYHTPWSVGQECTHLFRGYIDVTKANELLREKSFTDLKIVDNGVINQRGSLKEIPEVHAYHLLPRWSDKASGVQKDREIRKLPKNAVIAIGDAPSDVALSSQVGAVFIVKNALGKYSDIGRQILSQENVFLTHDEMRIGWAEVIHFLVENKLLIRNP